MKIKVLDGNPVFATHVITADFEELSELLLEYQVEGAEVICYNNKEKKRAEQILTINGVEFNTDSLTFTKSEKDKVKGFKYGNRSDLLDHVKRGKKPKASLEELESRIESLEKQIAKLLGGV